jgi:hypothetical protein
MKRTGVIAVFLVVFVMLAQMAYVHAQESPGLTSLENDSLLNTAQTGTEKATQFQEAENKSDYLKQEWGKILENNTVLGPIIRAADKASPVTNPLFKYTAGLEPSLTWLFILAVAIWIVIFLYMQAMMQYSLFSSKIRLIISLCLTIVIGLTGIIKLISQKIIDLVSLVAIWWIQLIIAFGILFAFIITSIFSKNLSKSLKVSREKREQEKQETKVEKLETKVEGQEKVTKALGDLE